MERLGEDIRRQREKKQMTIEDMSQKTKISVAVLKDIEDGKFDRYKGDEAYVKMYLRKISQVLNMDSTSLTDQYVELTREIELEELNEKKETEEARKDVVQKGKKFSFEAPQLARKPSVYEDKSHVKIIRAIIILLLVCMVIVVIWYGFYSTRSKTKDPTFVAPTSPVVEGNVPSDNQPSDPGQNTNPTQPTTSQVTITRNGRLDYSFQLAEGVETFTFKMEFGEKCWAALEVNGKNYSDFEHKIYHNSDDEEAEIVELTFNVSDFNELELTCGYSMGHRLYINDQEIVLEDEDKTNGVTNLHLTLTKK